MSTDHVVMNTRDGTFLCTRCNEHERIQLPAPIAEVVSKSRDFIDRHADCTKRQTAMPWEPTPEQLEAACLNSRHDYGMLSSIEQRAMRAKMLMNWRAIAKVVNQ